MNKLIGMVFVSVALVALPALSAEAQGARTSGGSRSADPAFWVGKYEFVDGGMNASGTRSHATVHQLEIDVEDGDSVYAKYRSFEGGTETPEFEMLFYGVRKGNELLLNHEMCFEGHSASCAGYRRGDPMLKLVAKFAGDNKPSVLTRWHKLGPPEAERASRVYFEKVAEFE